ncbi:hypothetical protein LSH36_622g00000 [Paralvinella palmiformis]|uniref:Uncharacterized protein n=1 Tax=Paralvinella palmiformis TaxID=53620 RepID=A0AAD9J424_9ANNE|nr:hypothetical protein LSH36_622g00000 [Paralvinella palmiformis]
MMEDTERSARLAAEGDPTPTERGTPDQVTMEPLSEDRTDRQVVVNNSGAEKTNNVVGKLVDSADPGDGSLLNGKRKKIRRKQKGGSHHRRWKPYNKLTWEERQTLEERETKRACRRRESRFASGQAMAPYNTTQFLMEQHEPSNSDFNLDDGHPGRERTLSNRGGLEMGSMSASGGSADGSSEDVESNDEEIFLEKDFTEAYEQYRAETLQNMSKEELVREHLQLEEEVESLKKQLEMAECASRRSSSESLRESGMDIPDDVQTIQAIELLRQVKRLKEENERLKYENEHLMTRSCNSKPVDVST